MVSMTTTETTPETTPEQLVAIGGSRWTSRTGVERYYINTWPEMIGLDVEWYKSGNVSAATLGGSHLSNSKAIRALGCVSAYIQDGELVVTGGEAFRAITRTDVPVETLIETEIARRVAAL